MAVNKFNGVLDRHDVAVGMLIYPIHHRCEGRALTRPGGTCEEHQTARLAEKIAHMVGQPNRIEAHHLFRNLSHHGREAGALAQNTDPEPRSGSLDTEVGCAVVLHLGPLFRGAGSPTDGGDGVGLQRLVCEADELAIDAPDRRATWV